MSRKKILRIIFAIIIAPVWIPIVGFTISLFGLLPMLGITVFVANTLDRLLSEKPKKHYDESLMFILTPLAGIVFLYNYIETGKPEELIGGGEL